MDFDGGDDAVEVAGATAINNLNTLTYSMWFYADSTGSSNQGRLVDKTDSFSVRFSVYNSKLYVNADRWSSKGGKWRFEAGQSLLGGWHHLAVSYDYGSLNNVPSLYLDGAQIQNVEELRAPSGSVVADPGALFIGNRDSGSRSFDGRLDEVQVYDRALTAQEVATLFSGG